MEDFKNASGENPSLDVMNCPKQASILFHPNADVEVWRRGPSDLSPSASFIDANSARNEGDDLFFFGELHLDVRLLHSLINILLLGQSRCFLRSN